MGVHCWKHLKWGFKSEKTISAQLKLGVYSEQRQNYKTALFIQRAF